MQGSCTVFYPLDLDELKEVVFYKVLRELSSDFSKLFVSVTEADIQKAQQEGLATLSWENVWANVPETQTKWMGHLEPYVRSMPGRLTEETSENFGIILKTLLEVQCSQNLTSFLDFKHEYLETTWKEGYGPV